MKSSRAEDMSTEFPKRLHWGSWRILNCFLLSGSAVPEILPEGEGPTQDGIRTGCQRPQNDRVYLVT